MPKKLKLSTPEWVLEGYDSPEAYAKSKGKAIKKKSGHHSVSTNTLKGTRALNFGCKTFKIRECPKCSSDDVRVVLSNSDSEKGGGREWECKKCKWKGKDVIKKELSEEEFMKYSDERGEEVS